MAKRGGKGTRYGGMTLGQHATVAAVMAIGALGGVALVGGATKLLQKILPQTPSTLALPGNGATPITGQTAYTAVTPDGRTIYY